MLQGMLAAKEAFQRYAPKPSSELRGLYMLTTSLIFYRPSAFFKNKSVPKHGAKNILPLAARFTVRTATINHITTQIPVSTCRG